MIKRSIFFFALFLMAISTRAWADDDTVHVGSNITIASDNSAEDVVCIFCNANIEGKVTGDTVVIFGSVHLNGDAQHDVVNIFGSIRAEKNASVEGDLVGIFSSLHAEENFSIGKDLTILFGTVHAPDSLQVNGDKTIRSPWIFWGPFLFVFLVIYLLVHEFVTYRRRLRAQGYPFHK